MAKRPVGKPIARFDDRGEPDTQQRTRVDRRQTIERDHGVELELISSGADRNIRVQRFVRDRIAVAIAAERVDGPLAGRREVEFVVRRLRIDRDEGLEAGVLPEISGEARRGRRSDSDSGNISVEAEGQLEFGAGSAHSNLDRAHRVSVC